MNLQSNIHLASFKSSMLACSILALLTTCACLADKITLDASPSLQLKPLSTAAIQESFFGIHIHHPEYIQDNPAIELFRGCSIRLWDTHTNWADIEKIRDRFDWSHTDEVIRIARSKQMTIDYCFGLTPKWASTRPQEPSGYSDGNAAPPEDLDDLGHFASLLAERYRGIITSYEIWNEPDIPKFFSGTVGQMVDMSRVVSTKIHVSDPNALILPPACTTSVKAADWLKEFFALCPPSNFDAIGPHLYVTPDGPAQIASRLAGHLKFLRNSGKPVWNTENGWYTQNVANSVIKDGYSFQVYPRSDAGRLWFETMAVSAAAGLQRSYYYALDDRKMGLLDLDTHCLKFDPDYIRFCKKILLKSTPLMVEMANGFIHCRFENPSSGFFDVTWALDGHTPLVISDRDFPYDFSGHQLTSASIFHEAVVFSRKMKDDTVFQ